MSESDIAIMVASGIYFQGVFSSLYSFKNHTKEPNIVAIYAALLWPATILGLLISIVVHIHEDKCNKGRHFVMIVLEAILVLVAMAVLIAAPFSTYMAFRQFTNEDRKLCLCLAAVWPVTLTMLAVSRLVQWWAGYEEVAK